MTPSPSTQQALTETRRTVNDFLETYYRSQIRRAQEVNPAYARLWHAMLSAHQAGGKRIRPYLLNLAYRASGGTDTTAILPVGAALELIHSCMLMHDDIIDRDYIRHGQPNVAGIYHEHYKQLPKAQITHMAESAALLGGDLVLSAAYQLILTSTLPANHKIAATRYLDTVIFDVAGGELLDYEAVMEPFEHSSPLTIAELKTANYSFIAPLILGARLADASIKAQGHLQHFGHTLGIAFQLTDDLLDIYADAEKLGKPIASDITEAKRTFLMCEAFKTATDSQKQKLNDLLGKSRLTSTQLQTVRTILEDSGAVAATKTIISQYADQATKALAQTDYAPTIQKEFADLVGLVVKRQA